MSEEMGGKNIFIFGMKVEDVIALDQRGYNPHDFYQKVSCGSFFFDFLIFDFFFKFFKNRLFTEKMSHFLKESKSTPLSGSNPSGTIQPQAARSFRRVYR